MQRVTVRMMMSLLWVFWKQTDMDILINNTWTLEYFGITCSSRTLTSSTLGHSFQLHICLLAARLFIDTRQTVRTRVPTITSQGWEATSRPWSLNKRANMVSGTPSCLLRSPPHLHGMEVNDETVIYDTDLTDKIRSIVGFRKNEGGGGDRVSWNLFK